MCSVLGKILSYRTQDSTENSWI